MTTNRFSCIHWTGLAALAILAVGCSSSNRGPINGTENGISGSGAGSQNVSEVLPTAESASKLPPEDHAASQASTGQPASPQTKKESPDVIAKGSVFDIQTGKTWADAPKASSAFVTLAGKTIDLNKLKGQVVMIDYWAPWCPPCRAGLPFTQRLANAFKGKGLTVIAMTSEPFKEVDDFIKANKYSFNVAYDNDSKFAEANKVTGLPTAFFINKDGQIITTEVGLTPQATTIENLKKAGLQMGSFAPKDDPLAGVSAQ